jgi:hypothetical protein
MAIKDDQSSGQIKRMIVSIDRFINAWNEVCEAWMALMKECRFLCEASLRQEYRELQHFFDIQNKASNGVHSAYDVQWLKDMALSLEKELRQIRRNDGTG